ncbi:MAG: [LysW]-aminoadipate kinase [Phycisphaerales bacterium]|nr:[LysW]-aminoadipate kinase [Phycisphaerales bacterium]
MSTIIIKIGGGRGIDPRDNAQEIARLISDGHRVVIVHGGSHETNELAEVLGHPAQTIVSPSGHESRRTDRRTMAIFMMSYCGKVNKTLVESLRSLDVNAVGLSGLDAGIWIGTRKGAIRSIEEGRTVIIRDDLSGRVDSVDADFLNTLLDAGRVPVLTPPAGTADGIAINVDADRAAAATAAVMNADELLLLSNVRGVLRDPSDPGSLLTEVSMQDFTIAEESAQGRMKNKVLAAREALEAGVSRVVIGSASGPDAIANARSGSGSVFTNGVYA